jgi:hypothetical protein
MPLILQIDSQGQPAQWLSWQTAALLYAKNQVIWTLGGTTTTLRGGTSRTTGLQSLLQLHSIISVKSDGNFGRRPRVPSLNNRDLFRRDHYRCAYCNKIFGVTSLSRDHIIPRSKGGLNNWMNCITACQRCNQFKKDRSLADLGLQLRYAPYIPNRAEFLILTNELILPEQTEFLLSFVPDSSRLRHELSIRSTLKESS